MLRLFLFVVKGDGMLSVADLRRPLSRPETPRVRVGSNKRAQGTEEVLHAAAAGGARAIEEAKGQSD